MVEEVAAEPDHHPLAETGKATDQPRLEAPAEHRDAEVDDDDHRQVMDVARADPVVDRVAHEQPAAGLAGRVRRADEDEDEGPELPSLEVAPQPPHAAITSSPKSSANGPPARSRSRGVPDSTMTPSA